MKSSNPTFAALRATPLIFMQRHKAAKNKNSGFNLATYLILPSPKLLTHNPEHLSKK